MSFQQKLSMVSGIQGDYVGNVGPIPTLKVPGLTLEDGPQGVADGVELVTCWPSALTVVATWDRHLMKLWGEALGQEQRAKGTNIMLGPDVNIARVPVDGRNYEAMGEDPYLAGEMAAAEIVGVQSQGVMATIKHWVNNNQEYNRTTTSANVDQRTQYEIYYPAFKAGVDAGVGAVMCSYNRINDTWACENSVALTTDLKETLGFEGFVMSDWGATHSTVESANAGLDMEMPDSQYFGQALATAIQAGQVNISRLDDMCVRIFTSCFAVGIMDEPVKGNITANVQSQQHTDLAQLLALSAVTLLSNDGILPLGSPTSIALLGEGAERPYITGTGSGEVQAPYLATPLAAISKRAAQSKITYASNQSISEAVSAATQASLALVFVGVTSGEGYDRANLSLPGNQDAFVSAIAAAQPNTVVIVNSPGAVLMPWLTEVRAVVATWLPGQEAGPALAPVLFGDTDPSGRLPLTFPAEEDQVPASTVEQYPGIDNNAQYSEGLLVGYRWYDAMNETPLFCFGHGLSYTSFNYSSLHVSPSGKTISVKVENIGSRPGYEVPQFYLGFPPGTGEPPKVLRGFEKVELDPFQSTHVIFELSDWDFTVWDVVSHSWAPVSGLYTAYVGSSSCNIHLTATFTR